MRFLAAWALLAVAPLSCLETTDFMGGGRTIELPGRDAGASVSSDDPTNDGASGADGGLVDPDATGD